MNQLLNLAVGMIAIGWCIIIFQLRGLPGIEWGYGVFLAGVAAMGLTAWWMRYDR